MPVRQTGSRDADFLDRFEIVVDPTAEPVDFDEVLADFLLHVVEQRRPGSQSKERRPQ